MTEREMESIAPEGVIQDATTELIARQEMFCQLYTKYWEATRAAKEAGYSEKTAGQYGYQLLQNPSVKRRIEELTEHALKEVGVTRARVLSEIASLATADLTEAYDDAGFLKQIKDIPPNLRKAIAAIESDEIFAGEGSGRSIIGHTRRLRLHSKEKSLELLGKHLRLFTERHEHSGPDGKPMETKDVTALTDEQLKARLLELGFTKKEKEPE